MVFEFKTIKNYARICFFAPQPHLHIFLYALINCLLIIDEILEEYMI